MFDLSVSEAIVLPSAVAAHAAAGAVAALQLAGSRQRCGVLPAPRVLVGVVLDIALLALALVFGVLYLLLSRSGLVPRWYG